MNERCEQLWLLVGKCEMLFKQSLEEEVRRDHGGARHREAFKTLRVAD